MIETVFSTEDLPAADRFDYWVECMGRSHSRMEMHSAHAAEYWAHQRVLSLGTVHVWPATHHPMRYRRTPKLIRQSNPETYTFSLLRHGTNGIAWEDQEALHGPNEFHIIDHSRPFELHCTNGEELCAGVGINVPKALLPRFGNNTAVAFERGFSAQDGVGALLAQFLDHLCTDTSSFRPADGPRLGTTLIDLLSALLARELDAEHVLEPTTRQRTLTWQIQSFIQRHLEDPHLSPRSIAAAHHISLSYLHRLFESTEFTVAAWIRHQRLERARRDLADPALHTTPIHAIAAHWGFRRPADFTRAFRDAYDIPPNEYRHQALSALE